MDYWNMYDKQVEFANLIGKTIASITGGVGDERLEFRTTDGETFLMYHSQSCCESVYVESITGDLADLIGSPILKAEESTSEKTPADFTHEYEPDSQTWTFYKLATIKGYVDIRWFGRSNGYYSESVSFAKV